MTASPVSEQKRALRGRFRARRRALATDQRSDFDLAIRHYLLEHAAVAGARRVAAYWAFDGEPDLAPLLGELAGRGVNILLPVLGPSDDSRTEAGADTAQSPTLRFHPWRPGAEMSPNQLGIQQPVAAEPPPLPGIDTVLIPLVAWDRAGGRLGMGAGYYDRLFAPFREAGTPLRVGVAYEAQRADALPVDAWDVPLHAVVTESGWFTCPAGAETMAARMDGHHGART